jgi:plastocyanin
VLRTPLMLIGALMAALLLAACPAEDAPDEATDRIEVTGTDALAFEPEEFTVPAGQEVTVELTSEAGVNHDFTIEDVNGDEEVVAVAAGESATGTFTLDEAGTYTVYCSVPGHREGGMVGTVEVVDAG